MNSKRVKAIALQLANPDIPIKRAKAIALQLANPDIPVGKFAYDIAVKAAERAFEESIDWIKSELQEYMWLHCERCEDESPGEHFWDDAQGLFFYEVKRKNRSPIIRECNSSWARRLYNQLNRK